MYIRVDLNDEFCHYYSGGLKMAHRRIRRRINFPCMSHGTADRVIYTIHRYAVIRAQARLPDAIWRCFADVRGILSLHFNHRRHVAAASEDYGRNKYG